jgi:hypothetical protein
VKKCIWCQRTEEEATFKKLAHTIPQSLGGTNTCTNVCDGCNEYFGNYHRKLPSVETALKEAFNISRAKFLHSDGDIGKKNSTLARFTSMYFNVDFQRRKIALKPSYKLQRGFQEGICRQFRRGLYKVYLEEIERQRGDGHNSRYDFIREFARRDIGDYPVLYFERTHGVIALRQQWAKTPELFLDEDKQFLYLVNEHGFFEFELLGHVFGIATTRYWELSAQSYIKKSKEAKRELFKSWKLVKKFDDIDLTLDILNG